MYGNILYNAQIHAAPEKQKQYFTLLFVFYDAYMCVCGQAGGQAGGQASERLQFNTTHK